MQESYLHSMLKGEASWQYLRPGQKLCSSLHQHLHALFGHVHARRCILLGWFPDRDAVVSEKGHQDRAATYLAN